MERKTQGDPNPLRSEINLDHLTRVGKVRGGYQVQISVDGKDVVLGPRESRIFRHFWDNPDRVLVNDDLYSKFFPGYRAPRFALKNYVTSLRKKVERDPNDPYHILTIRGHGFWFRR